MRSEEELHPFDIKSHEGFFDCDFFWPQRHKDINAQWYFKLDLQLILELILTLRRLSSINRQTKTCYKTAVRIT